MTQLKKARSGVVTPEMEAVAHKAPPSEDDVCTMCGKYCAIKQVKEYFQS